MNALKLPQLPVRDEIMDVLRHWISGVQNKATEDVVACYSKNAALWGTLTHRLRCDQQGIRNYFNEFFNQFEGNLQLSFGKLEVTQIADNPVISGLYTFIWTDEKNHKHLVPARYTFVLAKRNGQWMIEDHHSSALPN